MTLPVQQFQILSPEQANPFLTQFGRMSQTYGQMLENQAQAVKNQYLQPTLEQQLQQQKYQTQIMAPQAALAPQFTQAQLAQAQALPGKTLAETQQILKGQIPLEQAEAQEAGARTGMIGAQTGLIKQETPYLVQQEAGKIYTDPLAQRLFEMNLAKKTGALPQSVLQQLAPELYTQPVQQQANVPSQSVSAGQSTMAPIGGGMYQQPTTLGQFASQQQPQQAMQPMQQTVGGYSPAINPALNQGGMSNYLMYGTPYNPFVYEGLKKTAEEQAGKEVDQSTAAQQSAATAANDAIQAKQYMKEFEDEYNKSTYKGTTLGNVPVRGLAGAGVNLVNDILGGRGFGPEQQTDIASQNLQASVANLLNKGKITNQELQFAGGLKLTRNMDPQAMKAVKDFLTAKADRIIEEQEFLNSAKKNNVDIQTAQTLWNMYQNQRPPYDFGNRKINNDLMNTWQDYLTPEAVNRVRQGLPFHPYADNPEKMSNQEYDSLPVNQQLAIHNYLKMKEGK